MTDTISYQNQYLFLCNIRPTFTLLVPRFSCFSLSTATRFTSSLSYIILTLPLWFIALLLKPKYTWASMCKCTQYSDTPQLEYAVKAQGGIGCRHAEDTLVSPLCVTSRQMPCSGLEPNHILTSCPQASQHILLPLLPHTVGPSE